MIDPCVRYVSVRDAGGQVVDLRYVDANMAACACNRMPREEFVGRTLLECFPSQGWTGALEQYVGVIETGEPLLLDDVPFPFDIPGGAERRYDIRALRVGDGLSLTWRDVTERATQMRALAASEERFRLLAKHSTDVVYETDRDGAILWISSPVHSVLGWEPSELIGTRAWDLIEPADLPRMSYYPEHTDLANPPDTITEVRFRAAGGELRWMRVHAQPKHGADNELVGVVVGLRDCQAEVAVRRAVTTVSVANAILVRAENEAELLRDMCNAAVVEGGYLFAWYGRRVYDAEQSITQVASSTQHAEYLHGLPTSWGDNVLGEGPTGRGLRLGTTQFAHDLRTDASFHPWAERAEALGFRSSICVPVIVGGALDGVLSVYAGEPNAFDADAVHLMEELAGQVGFGLAKLRTTDQLRQALADTSLLMTAIDQAADSIIVTDTGPAIIYANPAARRSSGYSLDEMLGQNPRMFQSGLHDRSFYESMWQRLMGGQSFRGVMINRRKSGEVFEEDVTITPVHDGDGQLVAFAGVKHDLTRQRHFEQALSREHTDRDVALAVMREVRPAESLAATATALCQAVTRLDRIDAAIVMLVTQRGDFVPFGASGYVGVDIPLGQPIPVLQAEGIVNATQNGPWWVDLRDQGGLAGVFPEVSQPMVAAGFTVSAYAPIRWDGRSIGALAVTTRSADAPDWIDTRLRVLEELGSFAGVLFGAQAEQYGNAEGTRSQVREVIDRQLFHSVYQPIVDLGTGSVCGYEALTRFDDGVRPDTRIQAAHAVGLGSEIEAACARSALSGASSLPTSVWLSINFSPSSVVDGTAAAVLATTTREVVLEITEHIAIASYPAVRRAIRDCPNVKIAVDDAGAGFSSMRHILELRPDFVKLDIGLVRDIDTDPARQALAAGLRHFCSRTGTTLIAEGVERAEEAATLRELGVDLAQGYLYGYPARLP
ncbi:MAG: EAL domain-containing protein [Actinomycetota bacterium]|nr:EAL domain-containing protein [Actinomycetota bacterium]